MPPPTTSKQSSVVPASKSGIAGSAGSQPTRPRSPSAKMGNGASASNLSVVIDGETLDVAKIKHLIPDLKSQVRDKDNRIRSLSSQLEEKNQLLKDKTDEVRRLKAEIDKLKCVLDLKVENVVPDKKGDLLASVSEDQGTGSERMKRQGISGESPSSNAAGVVDLKHFDKDFR